MCGACVGGQHHSQRGTLKTAGQLVGPDACESTTCAVLFERLRVITRLEDNHEAMRVLEKGIKDVEDLCKPRAVRR